MVNNNDLFTGVRSFVNDASNPHLTCHADAFVQENIKEVIKGPEAHKLPTICVDIIGKLIISL